MRLKLCYLLIFSFFLQQSIYKEASSEMITLGTLGLSSAVIGTTFRVGAHCQHFCTEKLCSTHETRVYSDGAKKIKEKIEEVTGKEIPQYLGFAKFCASSCTQDPEYIQFSFSQSNSKPTKIVNIKVHKRYPKLFEKFSIKNCIRGYNSVIPQGTTKMSPTKEVSVYSQEEFEKIKGFASNGDYPGYQEWFIKNLEYQTNLDWER